MPTERKFLRQEIRITHRFILQQARDYTLARTFSACQLTISVLFHSPLGVLFTFPSRYQFTIGRFQYLVLERGRPRFPQGFTVPHGTQVQTIGEIDFAYQTFTIYGVLFRTLLLSISTSNIVCPATPRINSWFRLFPFRSPLLGESHLIYFPGATQMFQFTPYPTFSLLTE